MPLQYRSETPPHPGVRLHFASAAAMVFSDGSCGRKEVHWWLRIFLNVLFSACNFARRVAVANLAPLALRTLGLRLGRCRRDPGEGYEHGGHECEP